MANTVENEFTDNSALSAKAEWTIHWGLVISCFFGYSYISALYSSIGLFIEPLNKAFHWSRTEVTVGVSIASMMLVPLVPLTGTLIDRRGSRRVVLPSLIVAIAAISSLGFSDGSITKWTLAWIAIGIIASCLNTNAWIQPIVTSFHTSRSMAIAATLSGAGFASIVAPPLTEWIIAHYGWRIAFLALGFGWGSITFLFALFFLRYTRVAATGNDSQTGHVSGSTSISQSKLPGLTLKEARTSGALYKIGFATLIIMTLGVGMLIHKFSILTEMGVPRADAAAMVSLSGGMVIVGKFATGWMMDKWDPGLVGGLATIITAAALSLLLLPVWTPILVVFAMAMLGFAGGSKLQISSYLTSVYAGPRNFGTIFGFMSSIAALSAGLGPLLGSLAYDLSGSYAPFLYVGIPCSALAGWFLLRLGPRPDWSYRETNSQ